MTAFPAVFTAKPARIGLIRLLPREDSRPVPRTHARRRRSLAWQALRSLGQHALANAPAILFHTSAIPL